MNAVETCLRENDTDRLPSAHVAGWAEHAEALADWALARLVVRHDVYGGYKPDGGQYTAHAPLTQELLVAHFRGERVVGCHLISPDNRCKSMALDIDAHDDGADPNRNWKQALAAAKHLAPFGLRPLILDSNGAGGFHVRAFFKKPIAAAVAHWLGGTIVARLEADGFPRCEAFPKQAGVTLDRPFGNWIRIPGRHHKRSHWTRIYDATTCRWLEGSDAARTLIGLKGADTALLLKAHREATAGDPKPKAPPGGGKRARRDATEAELRAALACLPDSWADGYGGVQGNTAWLGVGMAVHDWDPARGLPLWQEFSARCPAKYDPAKCAEKWSSFTRGGGLTVATIFKAAREHGYRPGANGKGDAASRPAIEVNTERHRVLAETMAVLPADPGLFRRGDTLVSLDREMEETVQLAGGVKLRNASGSVRVAAISEVELSCRLTAMIDFFARRRDRDGESVSVPVHPPSWLCETIVKKRLFPGVRELRGVAEVPFPGADGTLVTAPGYDHPTEFYYAPSLDIGPLPKAPSQADARAAAVTLFGLVEQFPFATADDQAVWLAGLLSVLARPAIDGSVPGFVLNGNAAGVGKGKLIDLIGVIATGRIIPTTSYPESREEAIKAKTALALSAKPIVHLDNLDEGRTYGSGPLDSAITSMAIDERILGRSENTGRIDLRCVWFLSGNKIVPAKDAYRRWLVCNLVTDREKPEERDDLKIPDLMGHARASRAELIRHALTILQAHALAGRPTGGWAPLGSFEAWDRIVRGAVWYATAKDCNTTRAKAAEESPDRVTKLALMDAWAELPQGGPGGRGLTVEAVHRLAAHEAARHVHLVDALLRLAADGKLPSARAIGNKIRTMAGRTLDGRTFRKVNEIHHSAVWRVEEVRQSNPA